MSQCMLLKVTTFLATQMIHIQIPLHRSQILENLLEDERISYQITHVANPRATMILFGRCVLSWYWLCQLRGLKFSWQSKNPIMYVQVFWESHPYTWDTCHQYGNKFFPPWVNGHCFMPIDQMIAPSFLLLEHCAHLILECFFQYFVEIHFVYSLDLPKHVKITTFIKHVEFRWYNEKHMILY